ncbi:MAG: AEC family transporter [Pseudomonadota bacterium]
MQLESLIDSFIVMLALIGSAVWLRKRSVVKEGEQAVFARLVTDFALPALIFLSLSREPIDPSKFKLAFALFLAIAIVMVIAWIIGSWMRLERRVLGSVILVAGVGSTSTLGYSILQNIYGDNPEIMSEIVIIGEVGVILPLMTVGVAIASYFGGSQEEVSLRDAALKFVRSPIVIALLLGLTASAIGIPQDHRAVELLNNVLRIASNSLTFLVAFTIGLMLRPISLAQIAYPLLLVSILKLIVEPLLAGVIANLMDLPELEENILILEAAMPSGALAAVIAARYGCDAAIASALLVATFALSLIAIPVIGYIAL